MNLLPAPAFISTTISIADLFTKHLSATTHHRYRRFAIGDILSTTTLALGTVDLSVDTSATVVMPTVDTASDLVPYIGSKLATTPFIVDTGATFLVTPSASDFPTQDSVTSNHVIAADHTFQVVKDY